MEKKQAFVRSLPVMAGYIILGIGFGILWISKGLSPWFAVLMSLLVYAGSMQYVSASLASSGASVLSIIVMTVAVNIRHLFYSISMTQKYRDMGKYKPYLVFSLTDETFSIVCNGAPEGLDERRYYFYLSLFNQCYWVLGTVIGVVLASVLTIPFKGLEFSMTALFVVTFTEHVLSRKNLTGSFSGLVISFVCLLLTDSSSFLIPSLLVMTLVLGIITLRRIR